MVDIEIKEEGKVRKILLDGTDITKGCMNVKMNLSPHEIATVTVTYAVNSLAYNGKKLK